MTSIPEYPLAQVIDIKKRRVDQAEKALREKERLLEEEKKKLKKAEEERDKVKEHRNAKLLQIRNYVDTEGMNPEKVLQMKSYLEIVKEKLLVEEEKVKKQKENVETAKKNVEEAQKFLKEKEQEVEKLETHRKEWTKEALKEVQMKEASELDEIGSIMFLKKLRDKK